MSKQRCAHCGIETEEGLSPNHKSTCKPRGRPEDYMIKVGSSKPNEVATATIIEQSPKKTKSKSKRSHF